MCVIVQVCICANGGGFPLTFLIKEVGTQPVASSHAVVNIVECEEVGWDDSWVGLFSRLWLQLVIAGIANVLNSDIGYL